MKRNRQSAIWNGFVNPSFTEDKDLELGFVGMEKIINRLLSVVLGDNNCFNDIEKIT